MLQNYVLTIHMPHFRKTSIFGAFIALYNEQRIASFLLEFLEVLYTLEKMTYLDS